MSHYTLPDGNVQIAFRGGRTSAYMLHKILEANGGLPDRAVAIFTNTGRERPETLDFVAEVGIRWGVEIVWLEYRYDNGPRAVPVNRGTASVDGLPFETLIGRKRALPNTMQRFCTEELKVKTARRWLVLRGWVKWQKAIGIRADEPHRLSPAPQPRETIWHPLAKSGVTKHDVADFWRGQNFDLKLPIYRGKTIGGNCLGCFLKSEAQIAAEIQGDDWLDRMEAKIGSTFKKEWGISELRRYLGKQPVMDFGDSAYLCQKDGGECSQ